MSAWREALAPAKVNLRLDVLGRRPDGYHELDTVMLALDLADRVRARRRAAPGIDLRLTGPAASADIPADEQNLAWRAAREVLDALDPEGGLELELEKRVPSGAGLGGASSDAAAALVAAEAALGAGLAPGRCRELLAALGSDCVFFREAAATGLARCRGRGELVEPLPPAPAGWRVLLVTPDLICPTGKVYAALSGPLCGPADVPSLPVSDLARSLSEVRRGMYNRLEEAALRAVPGLRRWKETLAECGARNFMLTGSGSTFFALHDDPAQAQTEREAVERALAERRLAPRLLTLARPVVGWASAVV